MSDPEGPPTAIEIIEALKQHPALYQEVRVHILFEAHAEGLRTEDLPFNADAELSSTWGWSCFETVGIVKP